MTGELLDVQRGHVGGGQADPEGLDQSTVLGTFFGISTICLFLMAGGIDIIAAAVYDSYRLWPLRSIAPILGDGSVEVFVGLLQKMMIIAVSLSAPLIIVTLASDILLGFVARLAPSLNSYQMGAAIKSLILAALMPIYGNFLLRDLSASFDQLRVVLQQMVPYLK
jgi:type III secretion protein T